MRVSNRSLISIRLIVSIFLLFISLTLNIWLLSPKINDDDVPLMDFVIQDSNNCNDDNNDDNNNICNLNESLRGKIYIYDIPWHMREIPRYLWYDRFSGGDNYNESKTLNFGFGKKMYENDWSRRDFHLTHMHVLEVIFNERLKIDKYYITNNASEAMLFHIPYPFGLHYRFWERTESQRILNHHNQLQEWLNNNLIYRRYFLNESNRRPHILIFGRIAYETVRLEKMGSKFFQIYNNGDIRKYWILSIDRNCHGDPPSCWKRISMPHPSNYHPINVKSLKSHIMRLKESFKDNKRNIFISFCGYLRTKHRNISRDTCSKFMRKSKWRYSYSSLYDEICVFNDGKKIKEEVGRNKLKVQYRFNKECSNLYSKSIFCIQDGADSTTRKGLWDGIILGCIPVFLSGVMSDEFSCYDGNGLYPWYIIQQKEFYVNQLLSLPTHYIKLLQMNLLRLLPKILYTNGNAGFSDAFDLIWHCIMRKTIIENKQFNPKCNMDYLIENNNKMYNFDKQLGYDKLYKYLEI